jgi:hypothetical protein
MIGKLGKQPLNEISERPEDGFPEMPRPELVGDAKPAYIRSSQKASYGHEPSTERMIPPNFGWPEQEIKPSFNVIPNGGYNEFEP